MLRVGWEQVKMKVLAYTKSSEGNNRVIISWQNGDVRGGSLD